MKWSHVSPYFHLVVWSFNLTLLSVWLWELNARNVTRKRNIPAAFVLMTVSLSLAVINSCVFLVIGGTHELDIGGESTRQWMCAFCGTFAMFGQYLVRVSVWAFFVVRGSLVTSFHRRMNQIARVTPYILLTHGCLCLALCVLFVDVDRGHGKHHSQMCRVHKFPLWLLFVGPMSGDLFYGVGFFVIFYKAVHSTFFRSIKSLSTSDRIAIQRQLRHNLVLFVLQLSSTAFFYALIVAMNFSFSSFELTEMNIAFTNLCLFALFQDRTKLYPCCSRLLCPEAFDAVMRKERVMRELRGGKAQKRRKTIDAFREKEKILEAQRTLFQVRVDAANDSGVDDSSVTVNTSVNASTMALPIIDDGDDDYSVFRNRWKASELSVVILPAVVTAQALGARKSLSSLGATAISLKTRTSSATLRRVPVGIRGVEARLKPELFVPRTISSMTSSTPPPVSVMSSTASSPTTNETDSVELITPMPTAVPMDAFVNVLESEHLRTVTISAKTGKLLGVSEALVGVESTDRKELFRNITDHSLDASLLVAEYREKGTGFALKDRSAGHQLSASPLKLALRTHLSSLSEQIIQPSLLLPTRTYSFRTPASIPEEILSDDSSSDLPLSSLRETDIVAGTSKCAVTSKPKTKRLLFGKGSLVLQTDGGSEMKVVADKLKTPVLRSASFCIEEGRKLGPIARIWKRSASLGSGSSSDSRSVQLDSAQQKEVLLPSKIRVPEDALISALAAGTPQGIVVQKSSEA